MSGEAGGLKRGGGLDGEGCYCSRTGGSWVFNELENGRKRKKKKKEVIDGSILKKRSEAFYMPCHQEPWVCGR
jgi:hypothetical protein